MRALPLFRYGLLLVFLGVPARARDLDEKLTIRTLKYPEHPSQEPSSLFVAGQVVTALRFEKEVDPAKTKLLAWEGRFEPPLVGGKKVVLEPLKDLGDGEALPLLVTLVDGTEFTFLVRPRRRQDGGWIDYQVNVFKDPDSYNAILSGLYDSLKRERTLNAENERLKREENSVDHAYATLLVNGQVKKTPFRHNLVYRPRNQDMDMVVEVFEGPGKAAVLVTLKNTYYGEPRKFDAAYLTRDLTHNTLRPFALRMDRSSIVEGETGRIAVVADKSAFLDDDGQLTDLGLQIFRSDGLLQVYVRMEHTLIRK